MFTNNKLHVILSRNERVAILVRAMIMLIWGFNSRFLCVVKPCTVTVSHRSLQMDSSARGWGIAFV